MTSLADLNEKKKRLYRKWRVGDRVTVIGEGVGVIVAKFDRDEHALKHYDVILDSDILGSRVVRVTSHQLELSPDEVRVCVICEKNFNARPGTTKMTCGLDCAEEYNREQNNKRRRGK